MMCLFSAGLLVNQPSWGMLGVSLFWGVPGAVALLWGAGGARSWVALTPERLVIRNALRSHTYSWPQVQSFTVLPRSPSGRATTCAAVELTNGGRILLGCTALPFGWI